MIQLRLQGYTTTDKVRLLHALRTANAAISECKEECTTCPNLIVCHDLESAACWLENQISADKKAENS